MLDKASLFGMQEVDISGGEPLAVERSCVLEIVRHASGRELLTTLNTNTWFLDEVYISDLKDAGLDRVKTSLYGTTSGTHEDFTGKQGSFEKVKAVLEYLRKNEVEVWVNYVVTPKNIDETSAVQSLLERYAVDTIQLSSIVPSGRGKTAQDHVFNDRELRGAIERLDGVFPEARSGSVSYTITLWSDPDIYPFGDRYCDYLNDRLVVDTTGQVIPCCILPTSLRSQAGSVLNEGLESVLSSQRLTEDPVFYWLGKGHRAMRERLEFEGISHNLCSTCIEMLTTLGRTKNSGFSSCI
jgi:MoaA/NifB/PqqE/SkfB family radical SAM enzyme